jgi:Ca2+-binding RTX toxin-like protein
MPIPAVFSFSNLLGPNGFRLDGVSAGDLSGYSVASAGDVNGDGYDDVIIGAYSADPGGRVDAGSSYVVFGAASGWPDIFSLSSLNGANGFRIDGVTASDRFGGSVAAAGDVNGDGIADLIIGARGADPGGQQSAGSSYVVFGKTTGWTSTLALSSLNGTNGFRIDGVADGNLSGIVASAGDVNGDGFSDLIIGAHRVATSGLEDGASYVVFGKASGWTPTLALSSLNGSNGFRLVGADEYEWAGYSVSSAGDVNGDGHDDILIGAPSDGFFNATSRGSAYVVFGKPGGWTASASLSTLNGANGFRINETDDFDTFGTSVAAAGDVNGDGFDDIIIGAMGADPGSRLGAGSSYVIFGKASGWATSFSLASLNGTNGFRLDGAAAGDTSGWSVASAGDVNGDGFDDLIVGAYGADPGGQSEAGSSYLIYGKASGWTATLALSSLNGTNGARLDGVAAGDRSGISVASAGDVNRDGLDDLIIGAYQSDASGPSEVGASYVVFGQATGAITRTGTNANDFFGAGEFNDSLSGGGGNDSLLGGAGADTLDGGIGDDTIRGGDGNDRVIDAGGAVSIDGGAGTDTFDASGRTQNGTINLGVGTAYGGSLLNVEHAIGGSGNELISGNGLGNQLTGGAGNDTLDGGAGDDSLVGGAGADVFIGGTDNDTVSYRDSAAAITLFVGAPASSTGDAAGDTFNGIEVFRLTDAAAGDTFFGGAGADRADGGVGNDILFGNSGNDTLFGGLGDDFILPGDGADSINGSIGFDAVFYGDAPIAITLNLATGVHTGFATGDTFSGVAAFLMTPFGDRVTGEDNGAAGDILYGLGGNDTLIGQDGFDYLLGGDGDDSLNGGFGYDLFTGGAGADRFVFNNGFEGGAFAGGGEVITDFQTGVDKIAFIGATSGFASFTLGQNLFIQSGGVTGAQGASAAPVLVYDSAAGALWFDSNGNQPGGLLYLASLLGTPVLTASDFMVV